MSQRKVGIVLTYLSQLIKILTGLIYTPIMLHLLGKTEYGLYQLVYSVVSYLSLLSMGFGSSYMRYYSRFKVNDDEKEIAKLNGMYLFIFVIISIICVVCGILMIVNIDFIFGNGLTILEYDKARKLMLLMIIGLAITFPNSVFDSYIMAHEKFIFQKIIALLNSLLNPILSFPLLLLGVGSIGIVLTSTALTIANFIINGFFCFKKLNMSFDFRNMNFYLLKEMWYFTIFIFISQIIDQINWNVDKFLLGRILGTGAVAVYGIGSQINSMYLEFSTAISNVFVPEVNILVAKSNDTVELTKLFTKVGRIQFFIMSLILSGFILVGQDFINIWAGEEYKEAYLVILFLIIPVTVPLIQNLGIEIQRAKNMHRSRSIVYLLISIINVFISIPLIYKYGVVGASMGTAFALVVGNIIFINWYYHFKIKLNMHYFWNNIFILIPSILIPFFTGLFIKLLYNTENLFGIVTFGAVYTFIYILSVWKFGFNTYEKELILNIVHKIKTSYVMRCQNDK